MASINPWFVNQIEICLTDSPTDVETAVFLEQNACNMLGMKT